MFWVCMDSETELLCNKKPENVSQVSFLIQCRFNQFWVVSECPRSIHHRMNNTKWNRQHLFPFVEIRSSCFLQETGSLSHGISFWDWHLCHKLHTGSMMAPNFSLWVCSRWRGWVLCCLAEPGSILITTHVSFKSITITHWPFSPLYFIWDEGWWRRLADCMQPVYMALQRSHQEIQHQLCHTGSGNGGTHITVSPFALWPPPSFLTKPTGNPETTFTQDD